MADTSETTGASHLRVVRWKQFGQDRLYVHTADGRRVGWLNLTTGTQVVEVAALREAMDRALAAHQAGEGATARGPLSAIQPESAPEPAQPKARVRRRVKPTVRAAGESAQAEYDRRASKDRERWRATRKRRVAALLLSPPAGYGLTRLGLRAWEHFAVQLFSSVGDNGLEIEPVFDNAVSHTYGLYGALALTMLTLGALLQRKQTTEAFRVGAEGERKTGKILDRLPDGWHVFHDLPMPGGRGNVDHVVVGPAGVFTVETKNYANGVVIKDGVARSSGRDLRKVVDQANRQLRVMADLTGAPVTPLVVVHGKGLTVEGWFQKPTIDGVRFCSGARLRKVLLDRKAVLDIAEVDRIAGLLRR